MADTDIQSREYSGNSLKLIPTPFEIWAHSEGYNTAPAVSPSPIRQYADPDTQKLFEAWTGGGRTVAQMVMHSTLDTEALRERLRAIASEP